MKIIFWFYNLFTHRHTHTHDARSPTIFSSNSLESDGWPKWLFDDWLSFEFFRLISTLVPSAKNYYLLPMIKENQFSCHRNKIHFRFRRFFFSLAKSLYTLTYINRNTYIQRAKFFICHFQSIGKLIFAVHLTNKMIARKIRITHLLFHSIRIEPNFHFPAAQLPISHRVPPNAILARCIEVISESKIQFIIDYLV